MNTVKFMLKNLATGVNFGFASRVPRQHKGWQSIKYQGKRYQLFGGIREVEFIDLCHPIKAKGKQWPQTI